MQLSDLAVYSILRLMGGRGSEAGRESAFLIRPRRELGVTLEGSIIPFPSQELGKLRSACLLEVERQFEDE